MEPFFTDYIKCLAALHDGYAEALRGLSQEALDWIPGEDMNSMVILVVHVAASTRFWLGDIALNDPAPRDRDAEFRAKGLNETQLLDLLAENRAYIQTGFEQLSVNDLATKRLSPRHQEEFTVSWALLHALEHTGLHLGHAQITRQLWDQRGNR